MLQAPQFDGLSLDPFTLLHDDGGAAEVGIGRGQVVEALVVSLVNVVLDEGLDLGLEIARQEVVLEQDAIFMVWCQRSILPCVWGWNGAPRTCFILSASMYSARSLAI